MDLKSISVLLTFLFGCMKCEDNSRSASFDESANFIYNSTKIVDDVINGRQKRNDEDIGTGRVLSRQKRYLIFPEGSSLQVVFDQIIPIVDYTNYLILGITVALAWELPSKRPSELLEDVKEKLNDGTLGLRTDEDENKLKYIDSNSFSKSDENYYNYNNFPDNNRKVYTNLDKNPYYSTNSNKFYDPGYNYHGKKYSNFYTEGGPIFYNKTNWNVYPKRTFTGGGSSAQPFSHWDKSSWWTAANRISSALRRQPIHPGTDPRIQPNQISKHRIYPVFGKRSTDSHLLTEEEKFHLQYHRNSRHGLYVKIEKYLHTKGQNGLECVLKTLCETGQRKNDVEPDSFIKEIMRAIFTLPRSSGPVPDRKHRMYDEAHAHPGHCSERYPSCEGSVWSPDFFF